MTTPLTLLGFASGIAANNPDCALGPWYLYYHPELFCALNMEVHWKSIIHPTLAIVDHSSTETSARRKLNAKNTLPLIEKNIEELSQAVLPFAMNSKPFCVIGGDHSCAIGTWSAVAYANRAHGDIGLIWIDAHMDSHTPETSISQNIHGMPVAHLLGKGIVRLCEIMDQHPKIKPENLCLIGIRSYEPDEQAFLERLGVTVFFMKEVQERGIQTLLNEACQHVSRATCGFGITIDMDAIDPLDAPGVGCREANGIQGSALVLALRSLQYTRPLLGLELAEFNPINDRNGITAQLLVDLIHAVYPPIT